MGWAIFEDKKSGELVERVVELIVRQPLVNILRGAMGILVAVVGHTQSSSSEGRAKSAYFGFRALKPAVAVYPQFYEMVVSQLGSADHALCANALMLLNALLRDVIGNEPSTRTSGGGKDLSSAKSATSSGSGSEEWGKFVKKLQDLGVVNSVYALMQGSVLQDLAHPLLEFQALSKVMIRKWREIKVDLERPEHRRGLKGIHLASAPEKKEIGSSVKSEAENGDAVGVGRKGSRRHAPEKWRRLGFETESPTWEFDMMGFLGLMDITDYVRTQEDVFQKVLLEQAARPLHERCPIARASLATTLILYEHFEIEHSNIDDAKAYLDLDGMKDYNHIFQPLLLKWSRLHVAILQQFFRLWKATGAEQDDFEKVADLLRILVEQVVGQAPRTKDILDVESELQDFEYSRLRDLQMQLLELSLDDQWGSHLDEVRSSLKQEALQFVKEQRIRCLLAGSWFPRPIHRKFGDERRPAISWRFLRLSHNRRYLHYADFDTRLDRDPNLNELDEKVDLSIVSSVVSNVSAINDSASSLSTNSTVKSPSEPSTTNTKPLSKTKITINSFITPADTGTQRRNSENEHPLLTLHPTSHSLASEWLDGLLMLLGQAPITTETNKLIGLVGEYGLKIRLLNVKLDGLGMEEGRERGIGVVPSREGLDEDYWFEIGE